MDKMDLYRAVGEIDDSLLLDAEAAWERGRVRRIAPIVRWAAAAACLMLLTAAVLWLRTGGEVPVEPAAPAAGGTGDCGAADPPAPTALAFNDVAEDPVGGVSAMIALMAEDFVPMTEAEILDYFGAALPVEEALPELTLTGGGCFGDGFGVYRTEDRGTYYDVNSFLFADAAGSKTLNISLRTMFVLSPTIQNIAAGPENIAFTRVNGWDLALFRYTGDDERTWCHTEFVQNGAAWGVTATGLTEEELARALEVLLEERTPVDGPRTATGTVSWVDGWSADYFDGQEHHYTEGSDYITMYPISGQSETGYEHLPYTPPESGQSQAQFLTDGRELTVWLPGEADRYEKGDRVTVTYTGEPATIGHVWPGQIESVSLLASAGEETE